MLSLFLESLFINVSSRNNLSQTWVRILASPPACPHFSLSECGNVGCGAERREQWESPGGNFKNRERSCAPGPRYEADGSRPRSHDCASDKAFWEIEIPLSKSTLHIWIFSFDHLSRYLLTSLNIHLIYISSCSDRLTSAGRGRSVGLRPMKGQ